MWTDDSPSGWPPDDPQDFVHSAGLGGLLVGLVEELSAKYPQMDLSDAVAVTFVWLSDRLHREASFISAQRFPKRSDFRAYLRQAVWNAARATERTRRARQEVSALRDDVDPVSDALSPPQLAAFHECVDRLPDALRTVFEGMTHEDEPPAGIVRQAWLAEQLGVDENVIHSRYEQACRRMARCMGYSS